jgi:hypothetical protein
MATSTIAPPMESGRGELMPLEDFAQVGREADGGFPDGPEAYREAALDGTLRRLFRGAVDQARARIEWYDAKSKERATAAKRIRKWSLLLFALGTLSPILLTFLVKVAAVAGEGGKDPTKWGPVDWLAAVPLAEVGYVLLAVAGALVIFDQFFDASGSWIRYRQSQARLEVLLADLRFAWAELMTTHGGTVNDRTQAAEFVALLRDFVTKVELLAEEETKEWARRFNERIATFDANPNLKVRLDSAPAGSAAAREPNIGTGSLRTRSGSAAPRGATSARAVKTSAPPSAKVRLAIDDTEDHGAAER